MPGSSSTISPSKFRCSLATSRLLSTGSLPCGPRWLFWRSLSIRSYSCACIVRGKYFSSGTSRRLPTVQSMQRPLESAGWNLDATFACHHRCHNLASVVLRLLSLSSACAPCAFCASAADFPAVLDVRVAALVLRSIRSSHP
jgi:hypothetical protein